MLVQGYRNRWRPDHIWVVIVWIKALFFPVNPELFTCFSLLPLQFLFEGITRVLLLTFFSSSSFCLLVLLPLFFRCCFNQPTFCCIVYFLLFVLLQVSPFIFLHLLLELVQLLCVSLSGGRDRMKNYATTGSLRSHQCFSLAYFLPFLGLLHTF